MIDFEVADFLGKADEDIAASQRRWGPPGHDKWDIDLTLSKWNPQIILPAIDSNPAETTSQDLAQEWIEQQWDHGYAADLIANPTVRASYTYCRVPDPLGQRQDTTDVLLRKDIVERYEDDLSCSLAPTS